MMNDTSHTFEDARGNRTILADELYLKECYNPGIQGYPTVGLPSQGYSPIWLEK